MRRRRSGHRGSSGPATGDRLGACFPDGKCKEGLECRLPERICLTPGEPVPPDAGADASSGGTDRDASVEDAQVDATADGGACTPSPQASSGQGPYCYNYANCATGRGCCADANKPLGCAASTECTSIGGTSFFACDGPGACGNLHCCVEVDSSAASVGCNVTLIAKGSTCSANVCVPPTSRTLCQSAQDCGGKPCELTRVQVAKNFVAVWGVCAE